MPLDSTRPQSPTAVPPKISAHRHVPELDGVRGIAILGVMLLHFVGGWNAQGFIERALAKLCIYGVWGVDLFFVLSGFLITGILYDAKSRPRYFRNFYARRTLRIFPLYYGVLLLVLLTPARLVAGVFPKLSELQHVQGWLWSYLTNFWVARSGGFHIPYVSHFWSLAVEEHFYLVWPLLISLLTLSSAKRLCIGLSVLALGMRVALALAGVNDVVGIVLTPCRLDALCVGAWFALAQRDLVSGASLVVRARIWLPRVALAVLGLSLWHTTLGWGDALVLPLRGTVLAILFGTAIVVFSAPGQNSLGSRVLRARWLRTLGKYSYGLYVFHGIVAFSAHEHHWQERLTAPLGSHLLGAVVFASAGCLLSYGIAFLSYELFESRILRLKRWFEYRPAATGAPPSQASAGEDIAR